MRIITKQAEQILLVSNAASKLKSLSPNQDRVVQLSKTFSLTL